MTTLNLQLNPIQVLISSLSFAGQFLRRHWLLAVIYLVAGFLPILIAGGQNPEFLPAITRGIAALSGCVIFIPHYLLKYFVIRDSLSSIDPTNLNSHKSVGKSILQMVLVHINYWLIFFPLTICFILPGVWWATKASVSLPNLLSTDDGVIESMKKSHELMNGKFWQCFGFLIITQSAVILVDSVLVASVGLMLILGGLFNALFHEGAGIHGMMTLFSRALTVLILFNSIILLYVQVWLFVHLKQSNVKAVSATLNDA